MRNFFITALFLVVACYSIAQTSKKKPVKTGGTKYGIVRAVVDEPEYIYQPSYRLDGLGTSGAYYTPKLETYISKVLTITNCTQEKLYRLKDEFRYKLEDDLRLKNLSKSDEGKSAIVSIVLETFDTYKEASDARNGE